MLGDSTTTALGSSSGDAPAAATATAQQHDGSSEEDRMKLSGGGGDEFGERSFGGNRWPRQETIALLKIRSDMDVVFRDASVKGPLWEEVSRKLAELGYQRSAKKCKEKFENVYKYHKRTKEGRTGKADGKTYRFFDQLSALESQPSPTSFIQPPPPPPLMAAPPLSTTVPSHTVTTNLFQTAGPTHPTVVVPTITPTPATDDVLMSNSTSSSSSTDVDEDMADEGEDRRRKRKRKWKDFFERLMKEVIERQEELQKRFLEAIERREQERMAREETWRLQEMNRINREREILSQERSIAAAKDAAVMSFLQKISDQQNLPLNTTTVTTTTTTPPTTQTVHIQPPIITAPPPAATPATPTAKTKPTSNSTSVVEKSNKNNASEEDHSRMQMVRNSSGNLMSSGSASSSRWPKTEVHDLIKLRMNMDEKYQENGPKGPLWEEVSAAMRRMGYNRNAKRCKEKWENINKYFKKVKESNKRRPEDSKTCPYFSQLDAIYREKMKSGTGGGEFNNVPLMVQPEQQWPPMAPPPPMMQQSNNNNNRELSSSGGVGDRVAAEEDDEEEDEEEEEEDEELEEEEEEEEEEGGNNYELVASKPNPVASVGGVTQ